MNQRQPGKTGVALLSFALVVSLLLADCSDTATGPGKDPGGNNPTDTSDVIRFFPNSRNSVWFYEVYDSLGDSVIDTLNITIRGEQGMLPGFFARVWETYHRISGMTDSTFVRVAGDSVQFYGSDRQALGHDLFLMPLTANKRWENPAWPDHDSGGVQAIDSVSVPAGDFPVTARVLNGWTKDFTGYLALETRWVADSVGIIQGQSLSRFFFEGDTTVTQNTVWRLIGSNLIQSQ